MGWGWTMQVGNIKSFEWQWDSVDKEPFHILFWLGLFKRVRQGESIPKCFGFMWRDRLRGYSAATICPLNFVLPWILNAWSILVNGPRYSFFNRLAREGWLQGTIETSDYYLGILEEHGIDAPIDKFPADARVRKIIKSSLERLK